MRRGKTAVAIIVVLAAASYTAYYLDAMSLLNVGDTVPAVSARFDDGTTFRLADFHGKKHVVLFFYPKNFTPGCTKEVCGFRDEYEQLRGYGAEVIGVSIDDSASHRTFRARYSLPFRLVSDDGRIAEEFGVSGRLLGLVPGAKRVTYVIDSGGIIRGVFHHELFVGKHIENSMALLQTLPRPLG